MHRLRILLSLLGFILVACKTNPSIGQPDQEALGDTLSLVVVYTNDEHGWMAGEAARQCAPELASSWSDAFGDQDAVLILSGGDNWTGPAISTWFQGESIFEVMTAMIYTASAVGNMSSILVSIPCVFVSTRPVTRTWQPTSATCRMGQSRKI